jgi:Zn-dependent protease with chaperone function
MRWILAAVLLVLVGCDVALDPVAGPPQGLTQSTPGDGMAPAEAASTFTRVTRNLEPVAEQECRRLSTGLNCDFLILVDRDPNEPPNAYQSQDRNGRPVITFTASMLGTLHNEDELAFVMAHEAAHHIRSHLDRGSRDALTGAVLLGGLATATGASAADVEALTQIGAQLGARTYSKEYELEADQLGTLITHRAGYDPEAGVVFFTRLPDPGDRFLGTHPQNYDRIRVVRQTIEANGLQ